MFDHLHLVPIEHPSGRKLYVSNDGKEARVVYPSGRSREEKANTTTWANSSVKSNANRKQRYLMFKHAWGTNLGILVSRAVYLAWSGKPIPPYHQIHHLNGIVIDNNIDNLLCVSIFKEHPTADARQKALKALVPNGDLRGFDYDILRELQDPRSMSDEDFQSRLAYIRVMHDCHFDPRIFNAKDFHHWFSMPFEEFKSFFEHYKND